MSLIAWLQSLSTVILDPNKIKSVTVSTLSPSICHVVMGLDAMTLVFECWVLSQLFYSHLSCSSRGSLVPLHFLPLEWYHLLTWGFDISPGNLILPCDSSTLAFCMMYSTNKLNKQGDNVQPWRTSFPIWNQSVVPCPVLTVASWPAYKFLKRQVGWSGIPSSLRIFQFVVIHTV